MFDSFALRTWCVRFGLCAAISLLPMMPWSADGLSGVSALADDDDDGDDDDDDDDDAPAKPRAVPPPAPRKPAPGPQLLVTDVTPAQLQTLQRQGWRVVSQRSNALLAQPVILLQAPSGLRDPVGQLRQRLPQAVIDRNTFYQSNQHGAAVALPAHWGHIGWRSAATCSRTVRMGLIDTQVDVTHPALKGARIETVALPERLNRRASLPGHGTAVASVLVGQPPVLHGMAPHAELLVVDGFHRDAQGQERMDAWDLVAAMDALIQRGAQVINMSFAGAANDVLAHALNRAHAKGIVTVAAVGNRGPAAAPQYPAAYPQVLGVTAVDLNNVVFNRAGRGTHVDLAAPGVQLPTAGAKQVQARSGTSFAAPMVTAAVAALLTHTRPAQVPQALYAQALDLGPKGQDSTYGHGLLQMHQWCGPRPGRIAHR